MKFAVLALTLLQSFFLFSTSPLLTSEIANGNVVSATPALTSKVDFATIIVDYERNNVEVQLFDDICGSMLPVDPNVIRCRAMPIMKYRFKAPIKSIENDVCGATVIKASLDQRPVDGALTEITLVDNRSLICRILTEAPTVVEVHRAIVPMTTGIETTQDIKIHAQTLH